MSKNLFILFFTHVNLFLQTFLSRQISYNNGDMKTMNIKKYKNKLFFPSYKNSKCIFHNHFLNVSVTPFLIYPIFN